MHPIRKQRLLFISLFMLAIALAIALALYALKQNINVFYSPSQLFTAKVSLKQTLRVGGLVEKGSVKHNTIDNQVQFTITDYHHDVIIYYTGLLPDLFREGQGIVAEGHVRANGTFQATEVLAKHDENYMPPPVAEMLAKNTESAHA